MTRPNPACATATPARGRNIKDWQAAGDREHFVQFYRTDDYLVECLAAYLAKGIWAGDKVIVVATPEHRIALEKRLRMKNVDVASNTVSGQYLALDAQEVLSKFMVNGRPDPTAFRGTVGDLVRKATKGGRPLRAFGEMVALLWAQDNREAAIELEELWNDLARDYAFALYCAYPADCATPKAGRPAMEHICQSHACVISFTA
jgi:hypothetical protein